MDEAESMWMVMVVFRIDLMTHLIDCGSDERQVTGIILLTQEALKYG